MYNHLFTTSVVKCSIVSVEQPESQFDVTWITTSYDDVIKIINDESERLREFVISPDSEIEYIKIGRRGGPLNDDEHIIRSINGERFMTMEAEIAALHKNTIGLQDWFDRKQAWRG